MRPPTMVAATAPFNVHPSKGVFRDFDRDAAARHLGLGPRDTVELTAEA